MRVGERERERERDRERYRERENKIFRESKSHWLGLNPGPIEWKARAIPLCYNRFCNRDNFSNDNSPMISTFYLKETITTDSN